MSELYRCTAKGKVTAVVTTISGSSDTAKLSVEAVNPMFVILYDTAASRSHIVEMTADPITGKCCHESVIPVKLNIDWSGRKTLLASLVYNVRTRDKAEIYCSIFPFNDYGNTIHVGTHGDLITIGRTNLIGVYNDGTEEYRVNGIKIPPKTPTFVRTQGVNSNIKSQAVRMGTGPPQDVSFLGLTTEEQEQYIPTCVEWNPKIRSTDAYDWMLADDHTYHGTLYYHPTRDKEIHMKTEDGVTYRYNMDGFRTIVQYLKEGRVSGVFRYQPRRTGRNVQYHLALVKTTLESDLLLCDSDDSDNSGSGSD